MVKFKNLHYRLAFLVRQLQLQQWFMRYDKSWTDAVVDRIKFTEVRSKRT